MNQAALQLKPALEAQVRSHLEREYAGVFPKRWLWRHIEGYVEGGEAEPFLDEIMTRLPEMQRLLDVGCGYGAFVTLARLRGIDSFGVDLAPFDLSVALRRAADLLPDLEAETVFHAASALDLPFSDGSFDCVTMWNLLEHLEDARGAIREAARVLRPNGRLFVVAPNYASFRVEAHYHVPWIPLFPRSVASRYLRAIGRDSRFFEEYIYYRTNREVLGILGDEGFRILNTRAEKIAHPERIHSPRSRSLATLIVKLRMSWLLTQVMSLILHNPLKRSISVEAIKS